MATRDKTPALVVGEIGLVRSLGEAGIPVYVGSYYDDNIGLYSRYCAKHLRLSHSSTDSFADELIEFGKTQSQKLVFFSDDDRAVLTLSRNRDRLSKYYHFNLPPPETVEDVLDKRRFALVAQRLNLPVPLSFMPKIFDELECSANKISYPCVLKPASKDDWWTPDFLRIVGPYRKAIQCDTKDELIDYYKKVVQVNKNVVLQEYIAGNDANLFSANMYLNTRGEMLAYFIGHKLRIYPIHAGVASLVETIDDNSILDAALDAAKKLKITGHFNIQFKRDSNTNALKIMEVHTRNSLWCYLATGAGRNISAIAYYDMLGVKCPLKSNYRIGVKWLDPAKDIKGFKDYRRKGELTVWSWLNSLRGKRVYHVFSWKDPLPAIADIWFIVKRRLEKKVADGAAPPA